MTGGCISLAIFISPVIFFLFSQKTELVDSSKEEIHQTLKSVPL